MVESNVLHYGGYDNSFYPLSKHATKICNGNCTQLLESPFNYIGGKYKLLPQILPLFPKDMDTFVDVFCGGANVGINVAQLSMAREIILNDSQKELITLLMYLQNSDEYEVFNRIEQIIDSFCLSKSAKYGYVSYNCDSSKGLSSYNKESFIRLRKSYNKDKDILKLFVLIVFGFNNQIRFNTKGEFNLPCGKRDFNVKMQEKLRFFIHTLQSHNIKILDTDFRAVLKSFILREKYTQTYRHNFRKTLSTNQGFKTFIYADPPYLLATAPYNENKAWMEDDEKDLLKLLKKLDSKGIQFALSNVLYHKGKEHKILKKWLSFNPHFNVHYLKFNYKNSSYQTKRLESKEVLITNY